jgi:hypothetical protein
MQLEQRTAAGTAQLDLFSSAAPAAESAPLAAEPWGERLATLDLDALSPREAHALLAQWQALATEAAKER